MLRRDFLKASCTLAAGASASRLLGSAYAATRDDERYWREAEWYEKIENKKVRCLLCPRHCVVKQGEQGWCKVRINREGTYYTRVFGRAVSMNIDPIEKKPLFHFLPASRAFSIATAGCNFECLFCQNWELSQSPPEKITARYGFVSPSEVIKLAQKRGVRTIAFTYNEPVIFYEYMQAIAKLGKSVGISGVMITNGFIEADPMNKLLDVLSAVKVDFKAYNDDFYKKICHGRLKPVLETMKRVRERGTWLEMVHLTLPTLNDNSDQIKALCNWVLKNLGPDVPLHFTRFHPIYKLKNLPATPPSTLERAWVIAKKEGIHYPYVGNLSGHDGENTHCHECGKLLIKRIGYSVVENHIHNGKCSACGATIPGVWDMG